MKNAHGELKARIKQFKTELSEDLYQGGSIVSITKKLVGFIDQIILSLYQENGLQTNKSFCLLALGSYGRRELQLHSDIDLLVLHSPELSSKELRQAQSFIQDCWDLGLTFSHQLTTVDACAGLASTDLTVISSILDSHLLGGSSTLYEDLLYKTHPLHMWSSHDYFFAKIEEQKARYLKYGETAYNLEPNVKQGPGGLRDLHTIFCIGKRQFGIKKLAEGIPTGFVTAKEYEELISCQYFLWKVRFLLHYIANKAEDRLLFDHQLALAKLLGFEDSPESLAIEAFMKSYFKVIKRSRELNAMLLQWFSETILYHEKQKITPLDNTFQLSNDYLEIQDPQIFQKNPECLISIFLWLAKREDIEGIRANTIRLIREHLYLINPSFLTKHHACFMAIFKTQDPYRALKHMNRHRVLGHYLACFGAITGQMQYDLFHSYTVDEHTLFVIRNIGRFLKQEYNSQFPLAALLIKQIKRLEVLYLAAFFHDIGKGRGGDHSELGAQDALNFAKDHHLSKSSTDLLVWLVKNHLLMSQTAQRQDIYDPQTILNFCQQLPKSYYLDYLYLLTVADICATNPGLWNAWKDSLLKELYRSSKQLIVERQLDRGQLIGMRQAMALELLLSQGLVKEEIQALWSNFDSKYFLQEPEEIIAHHTKAILESKNLPLVLVMPHHSQGGTEVLIYMPHQDERFIITTTVLHNHQATIQEAFILTCKNEFDLDTYIILNEQHQPYINEKKMQAIQDSLYKHLSKPNPLPTIIRRRSSRAQAHFKQNPRVRFSDSEGHTRLLLFTLDRAGLLAHISPVFLKLKLHLHTAKIITAGERVEDMFLISNHEGKALTTSEKEELESLLINALQAWKD